MKKLISLIFVALISSQMWASTSYAYVYVANFGNGSMTSTYRAACKVGVASTSSVTIGNYSAVANFTSCHVDGGFTAYYKIEVTNSDYRFKGWSTNNNGTDIVSTATSYSVSVANGNSYSLYACLEENDTKVSVSVGVATNSTGMGTVSGGATNVSAGKTDVTINASANSDYYFKGWSTNSNGSGTLVGTASYTFKPSATATYYAVFGAYKTSTISPTGSNSTTNWTTAVVPDGYVDLGLPSGTLWAKKNLGGSEEYSVGNYYAWGSLVAKTSSNVNYFTAGNYPSYANSKNASWTGNTTYDAATEANSADHTPTKEEWEELIAYTNNYYDGTNIKYNGVKGYVFEDKSNSSNFIYLSTQTGVADGGTGTTYQLNASTYAHYWSSTLKSGTGTDKVPYYYLGGATYNKVTYRGDAENATSYCYSGMVIRPVRAGATAKVLTIEVKVGSSLIATYTYRCDNGEKVKITASDVEGYEFTNWKDGNSVLSTNATQEFTVTTDKTYTANYTAIPTYSVTFRTSAEDQNPAVKSDYHSGDLITNRPALDPQRIGDDTHTYTFIGWQLEGTENTYSNAQVDAMTVSGNMVFTASFDEQIIEVGPVTYNITIGNFTANANGKVVITSQGNTQTVSPSGGVFTFGAGKSVTIQAVPNAYYHFNGWVEDNDEEAIIDIRTLGSDLTYTPTFAANTTITLEDNHNQAYYTSLYGEHEGDVLTVIMQGRQLTEGSWMTFCAPFRFDIPAGHPFRGAVYELQDATMSGTNTAAYISLDFRRTYEMKANVPYLIVPTMTTLSDLEFDHVTIEAAPAQETVTAESGQVQFVSMPWQTTLVNDAQKPDFYLATGNNLRYVKTEGGTTFRAFRAYFHRLVNLGAAARRVVISLDGVETTKEIGEDGEIEDMTTKRMENGILYIERNGVRYDAQGQRAE